ncbi:MAG TPA: hypothetical protein VF676_07015 [Flavobacterium sp.]|jgi:hypothetical protein
MVLGRFYFKQTANGNLLGEFSNTGMGLNKTESADIISRFNIPFIGTYRSTWFQQTAQSLNLEIQFKIDSNDRIYSLTWTNNNNVAFLAEGFIVDDILIGDYRDEELQRFIENQF